MNVKVGRWSGLVLSSGKNYKCHYLEGVGEKDYIYYRVSVIYQALYCPLKNSPVR